MARGAPGAAARRPRGRRSPALTCSAASPRFGSGIDATALLALANALWAASAFTVELESGYRIDPRAHLLVEDAGSAVLVTAAALAIPFVAGGSNRAVRASGFPPWCARVGRMRLDQLTPILNVSDVAASLVWFENLGWERGFAWDDDGGMHSNEPTFASVQAGDDAEIFLCRDDQGARPVWMSWFLPSRGELDAAHALAVKLGYEISQEPIDEPWGMREFHLRHPDGHTFRVSAESG